jgi:hypothetical protein
MRSVALLTLRLEELGVRVVGLNIHEIGLHLDGAGKASSPVTHDRRYADPQFSAEHPKLVPPPSLTIRMTEYFGHLLDKLEPPKQFER